MKLINSIAAMHKLSKQMLISTKTIGLVPTMGALHQGHLSLIDRARKENDFVVVSIFLNPRQFAPNEDLDKYPKRQKQDMKLCEEHGVDAVFIPNADDMYPPEFQTSVEVAGLDKNMCGPHRHGHFKGVTTVVAKLFNIIMPEKAYFGQKDWQQYTIIKKMTAELNFEAEIIMCPIVRDTDGLALSSRNAYLSKDERNKAKAIPRSLMKIQESILSGEKNPLILKKNALEELSSISDMKIEYLVLVDPNTLKELDSIAEYTLAAVAVRLGSTRLIDNILIEI